MSELDLDLRAIYNHTLKSEPYWEKNAQAEFVFNNQKWKHALLSKVCHKYASNIYIIMYFRINSERIQISVILWC